MNIKKQMAWRAYFVFLGCICLMGLIIGKIIYLQVYKGTYWKEVSKKFHTHIQTFQAARGSIYSEDLKLLSVSTPRYHLYADLGLKNLQKNNGILFYNNLEKLSQYLAELRPKKSMEDYRKELLSAFKKKKRYFKILSNLSFDEYKKIKEFPLIKMPKYKGGFILERQEIRSYPYGQMAKRTIGLYRQKRNLVGLEREYNDWLEGMSGKRILRKIANGLYYPVDGSEIAPQKGNSIITTIQTNIQDAVDASLRKRLEKQDAEWGTCIIMEVATGKIKAISNLKKNKQGVYTEVYNYAVLGIEPGSTMKTFAYMALLEDDLIKLDDKININRGKWMYHGIEIKDSDYEHKKKDICSIRETFELSSNVGIAKLINKYYGSNPSRFTDHLQQTGINRLVQIHIPGEQAPFIKTPDSEAWSPTSLLWMSFGYEMKISPLSILTYYNAIANEGRMMQPYLVNAFIDKNNNVQYVEPRVRIRTISSRLTIKKIHELLQGVVQRGTARNIKDTWYGIAGKTGTSIVYNPSDGYNNDHYLSSFAGYFPVKKPLYSFVIFIQNKPGAAEYYGSKVASPVIKEIADKIMAQNHYMPMTKLLANGRHATHLVPPKNDQIKKPLKNVTLYKKKKMPDMKEWKLSDAIFFAENNNIHIKNIQGEGKIAKQSIPVGSAITKEPMTLMLELD